MKQRPSPPENRHSAHSKYNMEPRIAHLEASINFMQREMSDIKSDIRDIRLELKSETSLIRNELKLEIASVRADFRILLSAIIAATLSLGAMIAKSSGWL
jgi:hypothetical protein